MHYAEKALSNAIKQNNTCPILNQRQRFSCSFCLGFGKNLRLIYSFRKICFEYIYIDKDADCTLMCLDFNAQSKKIEIIVFYNNIDIKGYIDKALPNGKRVAELVAVNPTQEQQTVFNENYSKILTKCNSLVDSILQAISHLLKKETPPVSITDFGFID